MIVNFDNFKKYQAQRRWKRCLNVVSLCQRFSNPNTSNIEKQSKKVEFFSLLKNEIPESSTTRQFNSSNTKLEIIQNFKKQNNDIIQQKAENQNNNEKILNNAELLRNKAPSRKPIIRTERSVRTSVGLGNRNSMVQTLILAFEKNKDSTAHN